MVNSKLRRHKVMEKVIKKLMANNLPPSFKFKDTYDSIELPSGYTLPSQQDIEDEFDTLLEKESEIPKTSFLGDLEIGTSNLFVDTSVSSVGIGTNSPAYKLDVHGTANVGVLTATSISGPLTGNADTATALATARTIGGVSFDGSGNINLPGVNIAGNQNTSGNAATATALATARTIALTGDVTGSATFDGSGNISIPTTSNTWISSGTNIYYDSGSVGVGTSSPAYKLDVNGTLHAGNSYFDTIYIGGSTSRGLRSVSGQYGTVQTTGGGVGSWEGYSIDGRYVFMSSDNNKCGIYNDLDNEWLIYCYRNSYVKLYYNGAAKLETLNGGVKIHGSLTATGNVTAYSDIRHKKDIVKLENALEKVEKLNGYTYARKDDDDNRCTGVIAQEVLEVLPEAVDTDEKGEYAVAYGNMAGLFIEAFKELNSKLESAMARIKELENTPK
jgi:hypothetical protein